MSSYRRPFLLSLLVAVVATFAQTAQAQQHYNQCISRTAENAIVIIPSTIEPTAGGEPLEVGDEIAVVTDGGLCVGVTVWDGASTSLAAWGADEYSGVGGYKEGDRLQFVVWDASAQVEYRSVHVRYATQDAIFRSDGIYAGNAMYKLEELNAITAPEPTAPADGASVPASDVLLQWQAVPHASGYTLDVASSPSFDTLLVQETGLADTSFVPSGLVEGQTYYWRVGVATDGQEPAYATTRHFTVQAAHSISLNEGWNLVSSRVRPDDDSLGSILARAGNNVALIKDERGRLFLPEYGIDEIGTWQVERGYKVYAQTSGTLPMVGRPVQPQATPISLRAGWNLIGYPRQSPMSTEAALAAVLPQVVLAKDIDGLIYYPEFGISELATLEPGQGYAVYAQEAATLVYPADDAGAVSGETVAAASASEKSASAGAVATAAATMEGAAQEVEPAIGSSAHLIVRGLDLEEGEELSVWSDDQVVGHGVVRDSIALILVRGDETHTTDVVEGASTGDPLLIRHGKTWEGPVLEVSNVHDVLAGQAVTGELLFAEDAVLDVSSEETTSSTSPEEQPTRLMLAQNYPNPFRQITTIQYDLEHSGHTQLDIYNLLGQRVQELVSGVQPAGTHQVRVDAGTLSSGTYLYRLETGGHVKTRTMIVAR